MESHNWSILSNEGRWQGTQGKCYDSMLKSSAPSKVQMKPNASSTMQTLFCHFKCVGKRKQGGEGEREGDLL